MEYKDIYEIISDIKALRTRLEDAMKVLEYICDSIPEELWDKEDRNEEEHKELDKLIRWMK